MLKHLSLFFIIYTIITGSYDPSVCEITFKHAIGKLHHKVLRHSDYSIKKCFDEGSNIKFALEGRNLAIYSAVVKDDHFLLHNKDATDVFRHIESTDHRI